MSQPPDPRIAEAGKWPVVDVAKGKPPHAGASEPGFRVRGKGSAEGNVALCLLLHDICRDLGLDTRTPPYGIVRLDPVTTNPVLEPALTSTPASVALHWQTGGRRVACYLGDVLRAISKPVGLDRHSCALLPVGIAHQPAGGPVLMLHYDRLSTHALARRGARTLAGAQRDGERAKVRLQ